MRLPKLERWWATKIILQLSEANSIASYKNWAHASLIDYLVINLKLNFADSIQKMYFFVTKHSPQIWKLAIYVLFWMIIQVFINLKQVSKAYR